MAVYFLLRSALNGQKAWLLLKQCETNDDALLEGIERLSKMFQCLALWGGFYMVVAVLGWSQRI